METKYAFYQCTLLVDLKPTCLFVFIICFFSKWMFSYESELQFLFLRAFFTNKKQNIF